MEELDEYQSPPFFLFGDKNLHEIYNNNKKIDEIINLDQDELSIEFREQKAKLLNTEENDNAKLVGRERYELESSFINDTPVICTTLSIAGSEQCAKLKDTIDYLIVDEACQSIELSNLIPFALNPKHVILIGDHKQLPATIISKNI